MSKWKQVSEVDMNSIMSGLFLGVVFLLVAAVLTTPMTLTAYTGDKSWLLLYGLLALPIPW